jgi:hypothetical protein
MIHVYMEIVAAVLQGKSQRTVESGVSLMYTPSRVPP